MLYIVGLGLGDERDITVRGLDAVRSCAKVYMEAYTSLLSLGLNPSGLANLEKLYGKEITIADREMVEEHADQMLREAADTDVTFLVVGDPFSAQGAVDEYVFENMRMAMTEHTVVHTWMLWATTHTDLVVRAKQMGVEVKVIHNASVMNAVGVCGLQLYHYGETISIPFFTEAWRPDSFYKRIQNNRQLRLHTLCLLDIRVKEPTFESLCRGGKKVYEQPHFMTVNTAISQLLEVEEARGESAYSKDTLCIGVARLGSDDQKIVAGPMERLLDVDFGPPLHCLIIVGETHPLEEEMIEFYMIK